MKSLVSVDALVDRVEVVGQLHDQRQVVEVLVDVLLVDVLEPLTERVVDPAARLVAESPDRVSRVQHLVLALRAGVDCNETLNQHSRAM